MGKIAGVIITPLKQIEHPKGNILHGMKKSDEGFCGFGEAYFSSIKSGVVKAWKKHNEMTLNLVVPVGAVKFVFFDGRENSITKGEFQEVLLSRENYCRLTIPPGIWMGFEGVGEDLNLLLNVANIAHDPREQLNIPIEESNIKYNWKK
ncbi:MAG: dTDP-4-dehydrorhamnose 3,5-epimerase family protein [Marinifilaceae bacterium]|jgi:dTDP-4-dehydrorhamnose 3,5-epimerase|nr:dTDP-4-dehydrorhamnose 3,5-epimerase family protein [Marinifilaceae bacterium]